MSGNPKPGIRMTVLCLLLPISLVCMTGAALSLTAPRHPPPPDREIAASADAVKETAAEETQAAPPVPAMSFEEAYDLLKTLQPPFELSEYNGLLSVFNGGEAPVVIFELLTVSLPETDRGLLRQGIRCDTYEELLMRIEDYCS